jgi:hypothetical protein
VAGGGLRIGSVGGRPGMSFRGIFAFFSVEKLIIADSSFFLTIAVTERRVNALI